MASKTRSLAMYSTAACAAACLMAGQATHAAEIYLEDFNAGSNQPVSAAGWSVLLTQNDAIVDYSAGGSPAGISNTNPNQYLFYAPRVEPTVANDPALFSTTEPGNIDIDDLNAISFDVIGDNTDVAIRIAIEVGGVWYASSSAISDPRDNPGPNGSFEPKSFAPGSFATAANWQAIENAVVADPDPISLGAAPGSDLAGDVTAFGLYVAAGELGGSAAGDHVRIDNFAIDAVPEPGSIALLTLGGLLIARRRRA